MVTTNQKTTVDSQKPERKEHKYTIKENHQTQTGKSKRRRNEPKTKKKKDWKNKE